MDPRLRADETLARARSRGAFVVTPDNATSPMDASTTQRIPREALAGGDEQAEQPATPPHGWPTEFAQEVSPNPYQAQRGPNEFGPLGSQAAQQNPR